MGLARPVREQMFCVNVKPGFPKKVPVAMRVFGADRAQVLANGSGQSDFQARWISNNGTTKATINF